MKIVVNVSGGAGSALALIRCVEAHGKAAVDAVFADTLSETDDTYTFLDALEEVAGVPITRLSNGKDIWDVFMHHKMMRVMNAGGACKASVELKQLPLAKYVKDRYTPEEAVIATGLDWMEPERQERLKARLEPYTCLFPLNDAPRLGRCELNAELQDRGLTLPGVYALGWPHNNCGKYGCILAGQKQWAGLLNDYPEAFKRSEKREEEFIEKVGEKFTVLRDRRGGTVKPYPLKVLREEVESGRSLGEAWRSMCNCMGTADEQMNLFDMLEGCDA